MHTCVAQKMHTDLTKQSVLYLGNGRIPAFPISLPFPVLDNLYLYFVCGCVLL